MAVSEWTDNKLINKHGFVIAEIRNYGDGWVAKVMAGDYTPDDYTLSNPSWQFTKKQAQEWANAMMTHTCYIGHCCDYCYAKRCDCPEEKRKMYTFEELFGKQRPISEQKEMEEKVPFVN